MSEGQPNTSPESTVDVMSEPTDLTPEQIQPPVTGGEAGYEKIEAVRGSLESHATPEVRSHEATHNTHQNTDNNPHPHPHPHTEHSHGHEKHGHAHHDHPGSMFGMFWFFVARFFKDISSGGAGGGGKSSPKKASGGHDSHGDGHH
jgi:hypothetical protein